MRNKIYVGRHGMFMQIFRSKEMPTVETHGEHYQAVIGPFRTLAGAQFMCRYGINNPHCQCVEDAEKLAKIYKVETGL